jgi:hypothetical protein
LLVARFRVVATGRFRVFDARFPFPFFFAIVFSPEKTLLVR